MSPRPVDLTPTWTALIRPMLAVLENPHAPESAKAQMRDEIARCAKVADFAVSIAKVPA